MMFAEFAPVANIASDFAAIDIGKVWYRTSLLGSTLYAVDASGEVIAHAIYDPWGNPTAGTERDVNFAGIDNVSNYTGYTWDDVLGLYFAQNRFYDAENHRFTQDDPARDGANWYVYCWNNPGIWVDPWGLFLKDMVLMEGASGKDVVKVNQYLSKHGYYDLYELDFMVVNEYNYVTKKNVIDFQKAYNSIHSAYGVPRLRVDGIVDASTWKAMGFELNQTLEEEFWPGTINPNNKTLQISISGDTITIDYFPKIYAFCSENKNISAANYKYIVDRIIRGFKFWNGDSYDVFGVTATVIVNVMPTRVYSDQDANILIDTDFSSSYSDRSMVPSPIAGWGKNATPHIWFSLINELEMLNEGKGYWDENIDVFVDPIIHTAAHEFGHVLGLFDAYKNSPWTSHRADSAHAEKYDIMLNGGTQEVYGYNIAMMLYAFQSGNIQNYANSDVGVTSEVYYRTTELF